MWLQTGANKELKQHHKMGRVRHLGDKAVSFSEFLSCNGACRKQHLKLARINHEARIRLVCCVYLLKHKTPYNSEPVLALHSALTNPPLGENKVQLLKW